jgi:uncharacterized protein (TIGR02594 family)
MANLRQGDRGTEVTKLQLLLDSHLIPSPHLKPDGIFGHRTEDAVVRFQKLKNLAADGIVGSKTWAALGMNVITTPKPELARNAPSWMQIAAAELGVHEDSRPGYNNRRVVQYHQTTTLKATDDETPWCSSFVNWVLIKAGYRGTNSAAAKSWLEWGRELGSPQPGAITVIKKKLVGSGVDKATGSRSGFHVAFFVSPPLRLLGGNQGNQVRYSTFSRASFEIRGCRWPT